MDFLKLRTIAGLAMLIMVCLFSNVRLLKPADHFLYRFTGIKEIVPDEVSLNEKRFEHLKRLLPSHGIVGYITDKEGPDDLATHEQYLRVQYVLAPVIVDRGTKHPLIVGNLTRPGTAPQAFTASKRLTLVKDFGNGVLLLQGDAQ